MITTENKCCGYKNKLTSTDAIEVPSYLPKMLVEWSKAAVRTQPSDLLQWSTIYFRMKANGEYPPVKPYLDTPDLILGPGGLTPNTLRALSITLSNELETYEKIEKMWNILSLDKIILLEIVEIGKFKMLIKPREFIGIATAYLNNRLRDTMILLCHILSTDPSKGLLLDNFVEVYEYLARLNCADVAPSNPHLVYEIGEIKGEEENIIKSESQYLRSTDSEVSSENKISYNSAFDETAMKIVDTKSTEGIMTWRNDDMDEPGSLADMLNRSMINPSLVENACDDPDFLMTIQKLKGHAEDDILSLLSGSSIISDPDQSIYSFDDSTMNIKLKDEHLATEEFDDEGTMGDCLSLVLNDLDYTENNADIQNYDLLENEIDEDLIDENNGTDINAKYEDNIKKTDMSDTVEDKSTGIEMNKDFIVMLALVGDTNDPLANIAPEESPGDNESTESEFSLLDKIDLNDDAVEHTDNKTNDQTFDENIFINVGEKSTDGESSDDSIESQHSDHDQQSNRTLTLEKNSVQMEGSLKSKDDSEIIDDDRLSLLDELLSGRYEMTDMAGEAEQNETYDENINDEDVSNMSTVESVAHKNDGKDKIDEEEVILNVLPGVGPTVPENQIKRVIDWVTKCANNQNNCVQDHNLLHFLCPPLDHKSRNFNDELEFI